MGAYVLICYIHSTMDANISQTLSITRLRCTQSGSHLSNGSSAAPGMLS